jgi:hypothetical protein
MLIATELAVTDPLRHGGRYVCPPVPAEMLSMDLTVWLPAMFLLGLVTIGLMFAFTAACEKV